MLFPNCQSWQNGTNDIFMDSTWSTMKWNISSWINLCSTGTSYVYNFCVTTIIDHFKNREMWIFQTFFCKAKIYNVVRQWSQFLILTIDFKTHLEDRGDKYSIIPK